MRIGVVCHATIGGSGVIATELGQALARVGHQVHFICAAAPPRLKTKSQGVTLHLVKNPTHALMPAGDYALALASTLAQLSTSLDVLHVHYAIPHAPAAFLARQMVRRAEAPALVTTLHGTDVLTLGVDPALQPVVRHAVAASDVVTAPTRYLRDEARKVFGTTPEVVGNFVDTERFAPPKKERRRHLTIVHNSSFRAIKRVDDVVRTFALVRKRVPESKLVLVGDGPERAGVEALARELQVAEHVTFSGAQSEVVPLLHQADVFLLPSQLESFGLAALEAMACGVPVVASRTGGLPELIADGETGFLAPPSDVEAMAERCVQLLADDALWARFSAAARQAAVTHFSERPAIERYEAIYRRALAHHRGT